MRYLSAILLLALPAASPAAMHLYDFGSEDSAVMEGFTRATAADVYSAEQGFGWDAAEGLKASVKVHSEPVENVGRGSTDPPPIYTNALTEDCLLGEQARTFRVDLPAGDYSIYVLCGTSENLRYQYFDFDVSTGDSQARVCFEGGYQYRERRLRVTGRDEAASITLTPRSRWALNALIVWDLADEVAAEELIAEVESRVFHLPPERLAEWAVDPPPPTPELTDDMLTRTDLRRGFVLYHKPYTECVYPTTNPTVAELRPELRVFATPGEYEPLTFSVKTLEPLTNVRVSATDIGPVKAESIDIRHVRYMKARPNYTTMGRYRIVPDVLERFEALDLPAEESHRFWVTIRVPEDAGPGTYDGALLFSAGEGTDPADRVEVPVRLRVLDIRLLEDPDKIFGIYYRDPIDLWGGAGDDVSREYFLRKSDMEHADMVAHGTRNVVMSAWVREADAEGNFTADWRVLQAKLDMAARHGFTPPYVVSINTGGVYRKYMQESFGGHLRGVKMPPAEFFAEITRMTAFIESERGKNGWPDFLYYPVDEPSQTPESVQFMTELLKAVQAAGVKTYVTADPTYAAFDPMRPYVDVWCTQPFSPDRETVLRDSAERGVQYWCYPNHVNGENDHTPVAGARMTYGFGFWRSGFKVLIPWIYQSSTGDPFNYLDGPYMDFFNRSEDDGTPIPVAMWEAYREGYDDYRYVYTLETLIKAARVAGKTEAADEAAAELRYVWDAIVVQPKYKHDDLWPDAEFDVYRWIIARQILKLQELGIEA